MDRCTFCGAPTIPGEHGVCDGCYEWTPPPPWPAPGSSRPLPDTPPLGVVGSVLLGGFVAVTWLSQQASRIPDPRAALHLARSLRFRRLR